MGIDLHIHSTFSDGSYTPNQIISMATNLTAISITDHDTVAAYYNIDSIPGLKVIPGVEITAYSPYEVHVLGYFSNLNIDAFQSNLRKVNLKRQKDLLCIVSKLYHDNLIDITPASLIKNYTRLSLETIYSFVFRKNPNISREMFYVDKSYINNCNIGISVEEAIDLIKKYNGLSVLAHPNRYNDTCKHNQMNIFDFIKYLSVRGLDGIECYHESFSEIEIQNFTNIAQRTNLIVTGGSDFHGENKSRIELGIGRGTLDIPNNLLIRIKEYLEC